MRRLLVILAVVLAAAFTATLIARAGSTPTAAGFRTPDAGAACRLEGAALTCSSLGSPGSVQLPASDTPRVVRELPWWDASTPVLHVWRHGTLTCRLATGAILCRNGQAAFRVTRDGFAVTD